MNMIEQLNHIEIFQGLDQAQLNVVKGCCEVKTFTEGEKIFEDRQASHSVMAVIEGGVDLRFDLPGRSSTAEMTITTISGGKVFGWSSFVPPYQYRLSSYCASKTCLLVVINRDCLIKVFEAHPPIGYRVMSNVAVVIGTRFQQLQDEVALQEGKILLHQKDN